MPGRNLVVQTVPSGDGVTDKAPDGYSWFVASNPYDVPNIIPPIMYRYVGRALRDNRIEAQYLLFHTDGKRAASRLSARR